MVDANQKWGVDEAIEWMTKLKDFDLTWIEEPTSPDDVLGHLKISKALEQYGWWGRTWPTLQSQEHYWIDYI